MKGKTLIFALLLMTSATAAFAVDGDVKKNEETSKIEKVLSRLTVGGYGEAVYSYNMYSDNYLRYRSPESYKDDNGHGRFDLPHVVVMLGYDFGKGWTMGMEIEFEHGGTESAMEIEENEGGEYESEIERGGEVALEQFWIQKSFMPQFNVRVGHMVIPLGGTNMHHLPTEFFGVYRPEGENTIVPCTWHETGISLWGRAGDWRYEAMLVPGLDSDRFGRTGWIHDGAGSPYEFKIGNAVVGVARIDNYSVPGLRLSLSGYVGNSFSNSLLRATSEAYKDVKGTVSLGSFDFCYDAHNVIVRGSATYGHLTDSDVITKWNKGRREDSPSPKQDVASDAYAIGIEAGYDIFSQIRKLRDKQQKLYVFARYDSYDSMYKTEAGVMKYEWCGRQRVAAGINYYPLKDVVIKGEYSIGLMKSPYNNEPAISVGIAYAGFFK